MSDEWKTKEKRPDFNWKPDRNRFMNPIWDDRMDAAFYAGTSSVSTKISEPKIDDRFDIMEELQSSSFVANPKIQSYMN